MNELQRKAEILKKSGYRYHFERELYINRDLKKAISLDFIHDHSAEDLESAIADSSPSPSWLFIFNEQPSISIQQQLTELLG